VAMAGLELPLVAGLRVQQGEPLGLDQVRGLTPPPAVVPRTVLPVPVVPETC
jgi:hypothetical protein